MIGPRVALAHDYLSTRGGAERVAVELAHQFPGSPLYTSVYQPQSYPELATVDVRTSWLQHVAPLRSHYRAALPLLPSAFDHLRVHDADVVICSSSGWSHGIATDVPKIVYCENPPRWLYQRDDHTSTRGLYRVASAPLVPWLTRWDQRAAASCVKYFGNSRATVARIEATYRREAELLWPPSAFDPDGLRTPVDGIDDGYVLCVGRLLGYKRVAEVVEAFRLLPELRLVVVGDGPQRDTIERERPSNVVLTGAVDEPTLRWLYHHCIGLVSAANEDFGLTPVEAAQCGRPSALLRAGGFLDTCIEGVNGLFFDEPTPTAIAAAVRRMTATTWDGSAIVGTAARFSPDAFGSRLRAAAIEAADRPAPGH